MAWYRKRPKGEPVQSVKRCNQTFETITISKAEYMAMQIQLKRYEALVDCLKLCIGNVKQGEKRD